MEGDDNNFYFIFEECSFTEKYVTIGDRTLGTPQDLLLPINEGEEEKATTIDATPMLNTFEVEDFSFLDSDKDGIKLYTIIEPDDPEDDPTPSFSGLLRWTDGGFVNGDGLYIDDDMGVQLFFDDASLLMATMLIWWFGTILILVFLSLRVRQFRPSSPFLIAVGTMYTTLPWELKQRWQVSRL